MRALLAVIGLWASLLALLRNFYLFPAWAWGLALLFAAIHWGVAPRLLRSLYRVQWCSPEQFAGLYRNRERYLHIGVVEVEDPWAMTYGHAKRRVDVLLTAGLLKLFADSPDELNAVLDRELWLGDQPGLGAASALAAPLIWAGVTDEFFLGGARPSAVERGLGGGLYIGWLARACYRIGWTVSCWALQGRHAVADAHAPPTFRQALRRMASALQSPTPTQELSLRRAYAARSAILLPIDVGELGRLAVTDPDIENAAGNAAFQTAFHPPLAVRLGSPQRPSPRRVPARALVAVSLVALAMGDVLWRHTDLGVPLMAVGLAWLVMLQGRYRGRPQTFRLEPGADPPWFDTPLARLDGRWVALTWPGYMGVPPTGPSLEAARGGEVQGWLRNEDVPRVELKRVSGHGNLTVLWWILSAAALIAMGALLNLATASGPASATPAPAQTCEDDIFSEGIVRCSQGLLLYRRTMRGALSVLLLDAASGRLLATSDPVDVPGWEGLDCSAQLLPGQVHVKWSCCQVYHWGNPPASPPPTMSVSGDFLVGLPDLKLGEQHREAPIDISQPRALGPDDRVAHPRPTPVDSLSFGGLTYRVETTPPVGGVTLRDLVCLGPGGRRWTHSLRPFRLELLP